MIITLSWWIIPVIITAIFLYLMLRPIESGYDSFGFGAALDVTLRLFYLIPILLTWLVYFIIF